MATIKISDIIDKYQQAQILEDESELQHDWDNKLTMRQDAIQLRIETGILNGIAQTEQLERIANALERNQEKPTVARLQKWMRENAPDYLESYDTVDEAIIAYAIDQNAEVVRRRDEFEDAQVLLGVLVRLESIVDKMEK